ncbi:MAG: hypothetical protein SFT93_00955, partial [Rickettsiaceae bacterium]|nr:hypothetical protein [Rickettsiaceae bacterium]
MKSKESALEKAAQPESIIESNNIRKSRYFVSFDDSSDEEDSVESYNISKNLKSQYDKPAFPALQYKFSFITHALALQLFYSKPVQDKYYILKKQYLSYQENELPSHEKVKEWVEAAMYEVLLENYFRLPEGYDEISQTICKKFMAENQNQLQAIIDKITEDCGALFHALSTKNYQRVIDKIKNELIELLDQVAQFIDTQVDPSPPSQKDITRETLSHLSDLNETLESIDSNEIKESIEYIPTTENNRITGSKKNKKKVEKDLANPITPVQKAIKDCHKGLSDSGPGVLSENFMTRVTEHTVQLRLHDLIKNKEESKTYKEIEDYMVKHGFGEFDIKVHLQKNIDEIQMNNISIRINIRLFQETENLEYQTPPTQIDRIDNNAASDELLEYNSLNNIMKNLNLVSRKTLEDSFIFDLSHTENNFYTEFLATLRLCNRSFIRMLKDRTALDGDYGYYLKKEGLSRSWKFPASKHHIIDIHSLTGSKDELRQDQTESVGSYASIFNTIKNIKSLIYKCYNCNVEDADIANLIRSIMNGDKLDQFSNLNTNKENYQNISARHKDLILKDLVRISYVMFGSEVVRNPASIIHNLMILDMIIKDKMSWEDALYSFFRPVDMNDNNESDGGILPMSMKEAVMAARTLHNEYSKRMPIPYKYDRAFYSNNPRCADLMKREHEITKKWLEMRQATSSNPEEKNEEITLESQIRQIANFLQEQLKIPLSLIEPDTQSDNISEKQLQTSSSLIESSSSSLLQNVESEDEQVEILTEKFAEVSIKPSAKVSFDKIDLLSYNTPYVKPVKKEQQNMKDVREKLLTKAQETLEEIYNTIGWGKTYESKKPAAITEER